MPGGQTMQEIYAQAYEYIKQQGMFIDRGDASGHDWSLGDLTMDGSWHDLDLSSIVPQYANAVLLRIESNNAFVATLFQLRTKGNANAHNVARYLTAQGGIEDYTSLIVAPDPDRVIEYFGSGVGWNSFDIIIGGWWF